MGVILFLIWRTFFGAKFAQHRYNIPQDILDFVIYLCAETICDFNSKTKSWTSLEWEKILKKRGL